MTIQRGDYVRPNNPRVGLPRGSVWRVVCSSGALKLEPENDIARNVSRSIVGCRFPARDFEEVVLHRGHWRGASTVDLLCDTAEPSEADRDAEYVFERSPNFTNRPKAQTNAVATAEANLTNAANATAAIEGLLKDARKLEAQSEAELQAAKLAKAKADKEAAAKAKAEEAKRQLAARLHSDRCLGEATLELIAEVSRLNNGGSEQVADASIAQHIDQLQALAKSYGYRIAKPSLLAQVVKL